MLAVGAVGVGAVAADNPNGDAMIQNPPTEAVSALQFSPTNNAVLLGCGSWDSSVRVYQIDPNSGGSMAKAGFSCQGPVLAISWFPDGARLVSGSADRAVRMFDVNSQQQQQIGQHDAPVREVFVLGQFGVVASIGWDNKLRYWDTRQATPALDVPLPSKPFCADVRGNTMVIACADSTVYGVRLTQQTMGSVAPVFKSKLVYATRAVRIFPNELGAVLGGIEGRCSVQYFDPQVTNHDFQFKCHRDTTVVPNQVFMVNDLSVHAQKGTFVSAGADGTMHIWDKDNQSRTKQFKKCALPITRCHFHDSGFFLAYAQGYDWHMGASGYRAGCGLLVHRVIEDEVTPKPAVKQPTAGRRR